jgi:L-ascorbate metabolism protein UlaG (beta-lactamase superfamily)
MRDALSRMQQAPLASMWLGHATVLLRLDGRWILTDPVLSDQIGVRVGLRTAGLTIGPRRLLPAPPPELLPPLDLIVLSHAHFDHLDRPTLAKLASKRTRVLTASGTAKLVPRGFASVHEILWDTQAEHDGLRVQSIKPAHWGARTMWDRHRGFASYVLRSPHLGVLYAGDTARTDAYANLSPLRTGQPALQLSIFGIGAYDPWIAAHANPEEVWQMHQQSGARCLMPMHHSTFVLSDEPLQEPLQRLMSVAGPQSDRVVGTTLGQPWLLD